MRKPEMKTPSTNYWPLTYFFSYLLISLIIFFIGPVSYRDMNVSLLLFFMFMFFCLFGFGYSIGIADSTGNYSNSNYHETQVLKWVGISIVVSCGLQFFAFSERLVAYGVSLDASNLFSLGETYKKALLFRPESTVVSVQLLTLLSPVVLFAMVLGTHYYKKLSPRFRLLWITLIVIHVLNSLMFLGTQRAVGNLVIYWFALILIRDAKAGTRLRFKVVLALVFVILPLSAYVQYSRLIAYGVNLETAATMLFHRSMTIDVNNWVFIIFGPKIGLLLTIVFLYFTMGYYGLSLSLELPFEWTYGIGNSFALMGYAQQYFGWGGTLIDYTYPLRVEATMGWPALRYWNTIFPWLASDFTFPGSLVILCLVAVLCAKTWKEILLYDNPISILIFAQICILLVFVPSNNQLMQTRDSTIAWIVTLVLWGIFHKKFNRAGDNTQLDNDPYLGYKRL